MSDDPKKKLRKFVVFLSCLAVLSFVAPLVARVGARQAPDPDGPKAQKLYWFIPDGMRAEPVVFNVFKWAREGKLPHIKRMMEEGAYGYCIPNFPSHTPVNFATLLTGAYPKTHGVADGPMHVEGRTLDGVAVTGFSSVARKVPAIWTTLEEAGKSVVLLSIPGSTPPELDEGFTIRGRWGGWGADFHAINFQSRGDLSARRKQGRSVRMFFMGPELTRYIEVRPAAGWSGAPRSSSPPLEAQMTGWGAAIFVYFYDTRDDGKVRYDRVVFSLDKKIHLADLAQGQWTPWLPIVLRSQDQDVASHVKIKIIALDMDDAQQGGFFRIRCVYNNLNRLIVKPSFVADELIAGAGPMVDFVDNFPAQLVYYPEDKKTFLEEAQMSWEWHRHAARFILETYRPDVFIQDPYTPNQMLTSRWWLGFIDPLSARYHEVSEEQRQALWEEVLKMYQEIDAVLGEYLRRADPSTLVVLSSDHGAAPLEQYVNLNNLFAKEGLLVFSVNQETGEPVIDWERSRVIFLKMDNIYIHSRGLSGPWKRDSGPAYEILRRRVIKILEKMRDEHGRKPLAKVVRWEDAEGFWDLPPDRVGDLVVANAPGFGWNEEMSQDKAVFSVPLVTGYKQAIVAQTTQAMWTPFVIVGPGVKKNYALKKPIKMVDQYPTIMRLLGVKIPGFVEGRVVEEIFE
ncbi:MAG: alkaline phosphatase family protein [Candidatus Omnitrophica bacterium]|nr:alkaline phosphatase family protein [Candidatus Omnitrophota bacterium]